MELKKQLKNLQFHQAFSFSIEIGLFSLAGFAFGTSQPILGFTCLAFGLVYAYITGRRIEQCAILKYKLENEHE